MATTISGNSDTSIGGDTTIDGDITADNWPTNGSVVGYQQGLWIPAWKNFTDGTGNPTISLQAGWWVRVGNLVTAQFMISTEDLNGLTSYACLYDLPYPAAPNLPDTGVTSQQSIVNVSYYNKLIDPLAGTNWTAVTGYVVTGESKARFYGLRTDGSQTSLNYSKMQANSSWRGQASYLTDNTDWTPENGATVSS